MNKQKLSMGRGNDIGKDRRMGGKALCKGAFVSIAFVASLAASGSTAPQVSNVSITQHPVTHLVTVTYEIDKPAVVTMDVTTNGVSIGGENL